MSLMSLGASPLGFVLYQSSLYLSSVFAGPGSGAWSAVLALEMPVIGRLFDLRSYGSAFALATLLPIVGYAVWRVLDGGVPDNSEGGSGAAHGCVDIP